MGELAQRAAELVVLSVVVAALDGVAAHDEGLAVVVVGLVRVEVDLAEQLLLVMLEFARHFGGGVGRVRRVGSLRSATAADFEDSKS